MLLDMAEAAVADRVLVGPRVGGLTGAQLARAARGGASEIRRSGAKHVAFIGVNHPAFPVTVLAASLAGIPVTPLNYRLAPGALRELACRLPRPFVVGDPACLSELRRLPTERFRVGSSQWLALAAQAQITTPATVDDHEVAVMLFTSGTTSTPKGVLLRHSHLVSYVTQTVEFAGADEGEAALISTPPYHVAGVGAVFTNLYAGRRTVHLGDFSPQAWLEIVRAERITSAMVVPTMLSRILDHLGGEASETPSLRAIAYGGSRIAPSVTRRALATFSGVGFTNAYGLTETSSTISVLGPDEHRDAVASDDPKVRARLTSAGRLVPGVEGQVRDAAGRVLPAGDVGELWVRGPQISGEYSGLAPSLDVEGWFSTRDRAHFDDEGYLFIEGRTDDTIIRGGENIAPSEIEDVLLTHPAVADAAVFGTPDEDWGSRIVAVIVTSDKTDPGSNDPASFREFVRARLRSSRTPDEVHFAEQLPYTATGKLLRNKLASLLPAH